MAVKLKDIAQAAGVSISTVSRILNRDPSRKTGDATSRKVLETAREMGYFAENLARLRDHGEDGALEAGIAAERAPAYAERNDAQVSGSIACVFTSDHESFVSPFFSSLLAGIQHELERMGATLKYRFFVMNMKDRGFSGFLESTPLDCGIMLGRTSLENIVRLRSRIPNLVYAGVNSIGNEMDEVLCDGYEGARCAVRHLVGLGNREIGFIGSTLRKYQVFNEHRYQGYLDELAASGLEARDEFVMESLLTSADGYEAMIALVDRGRLPSALFCGNDTVALGAMRALHERGISIPGDISVMGFDDIETASFTKPALSTIAVPTKELGRLAVKVMFDRLESGRDYPIRVNLPFRLVDRESCRRIADA